MSEQRTDEFAQRLAALGVEPAKTSAGLVALLEGPLGHEALARAEALPDPALELGLSPSLIELLREGSYPARLLGLHPAAARLLHGEPPRFAPEQMRERLASWTAQAPVSEAIARLRTEVYLGLARRELEAAPLEEVGQALTDLIRACVEASFDAIDPNLAKEVCVFAMGKLSADELNYLSDVDLIFVHADRSGADGDAGAGHRYRSDLHAKLRRVVRDLEGPAQWRPVFRVDLRLRPFGTRGPMSMSESASLNYYERHGRDWERQAWLRGKALAGNLALGERFEARLRPFVYRRTLGPSIFDEVEAVMARARRDARRKRLAGASVDLKHDRGGIREIEFFVQAHQLMHGGRHPAIRTTSTLAALDRLAVEGLLSDREHRTLNDAYRFLRRLEHRVQLSEGQQRHDLPHDAAQLDQLARGLQRSGVLNVDATEHDPAQHVAGQTLLHELDTVRAAVCEVTAMFGGDEAPQSSQAESRAWAREVILDAGAPHEHCLAALAQLGVRDPAEAAAVIAHLDSRAEGPLRARGPARDGAIALLFACLDSADPDAALRRMSDFSSTRPSHFAAWRYFADPKQREVVRRVADLFGASDPLSRGLIGFPNARGIADDGALGMLGAASQTALPTREEFIEDWASAETRELSGEALDRALLRFKSRQLVRIGSYDLGQRADPLEVGACLSELADLIVAECAADIDTARPDDPALACSVFALGKYGMEAMDYGSDLDLFFVFESEAPGLHVNTATRLARRFLSRLQGAHASARLYEVDMRLRPSGGQGLLVSSLGGYADYHRKGLPIWERLALLRTRAVASIVIGDPIVPASEVARRVTQEILPTSIFGHAEDQRALSTALRSLKTRIENEVARETRTHLDAKSGRGACLELELLVSALQLQHADAPGSAMASASINPAPQIDRVGASRDEPTPNLRARNILHALSALESAGVLAAGEAEHLADAYRFLRRFLNRLRMLSGRGGAHNPDRFDLNSPRLGALARRMGLASVEVLLDDYRRHSNCVRDAFDRHLPA